MKVNQIEWVVFDVETTGLSPVGGDRIIEIAAVKVRDEKIVATFDSLVNPKRDVPVEAQQVNNITLQMLADAPAADEILPSIIEFIGGGCLVAHNIKFDLDFLCHGLSLIGRKLNDSTPAIDTLKMSKKFLPQLSSHRLINIAQYFGVATKDAHRALADVKMTVTVLKRFLDMAVRQGIMTPQDLFKEFGVAKPGFKIAQASQEVLF